MKSFLKAVLISIIFFNTSIYSGGDNRIWNSDGETFQVLDEQEVEPYIDVSNVRLDWPSSGPETPSFDWGDHVQDSVIEAQRDLNDQISSSTSPAEDLSHPTNQLYPSNHHTNSSSSIEPELLHSPCPNPAPIPPSLPSHIPSTQPFTGVSSAEFYAAYPERMPTAPTISSPSPTYTTGWENNHILQHSKQQAQLALVRGAMQLIWHSPDIFWSAIYDIQRAWNAKRDSAREKVEVNYNYLPPHLRTKYYDRVKEWFDSGASDTSCFEDLFEDHLQCKRAELRRLRLNPDEKSYKRLSLEKELMSPDTACEIETYVDKKYSERSWFDWDYWNRPADYLKEQTRNEAFRDYCDRAVMVQQAAEVQEARNQARTQEFQRRLAEVDRRENPDDYERPLGDFSRRSLSRTLQAQPMIDNILTPLGQAAAQHAQIDVSGLTRFTPSDETQRQLLNKIEEYLNNAHHWVQTDQSELAQKFREIEQDVISFAVDLMVANYTKAAQDMLSLAHHMSTFSMLPNRKIIDRLIHVGLHPVEYVGEFADNAIALCKTIRDIDLQGIGKVAGQLAARVARHAAAIEVETEGMSAAELVHYFRSQEKLSVDISVIQNALSQVTVSHVEDMIAREAVDTAVFMGASQVVKGVPKLVRATQKLAELKLQPLKTNLCDALTSQRSKRVIGAVAKRLGLEAETVGQLGTLFETSKEHSTLKKAVEVVLKEVVPTKTISRLSPSQHLTIREWEKLAQQAESLYTNIRNNPLDISRIAAKLGVKEATILRVKNHVFFENHILHEGLHTFHADLDMAEAWLRLESGNFLQSDITWILHEHAEALIMRGDKIPYEAAHKVVDKVYNWRKLIE